MAAEVWITLLLTVLGILFITTGTLLLVRAGKTAAPSRARFIRSWCLLGLGVCMAGVAGLIIWQRPVAFVQLFESDYDNPERLERLRATPLEALSRPDALAGAWPQWRGPRRDGISDETGLRTDWAKTPPVLWQQPIGGGYSSVAVADGRLYTMDKQGDDERVVCLAAGTGKELWAHRYRVDYSAFRQGHGTGPRATPTVAGGRVYTVGATGVFLCLEAAPRDGRPHVLWEHNLMEDFDARPPIWGVACSPLVEGKLVCVQPGGKKGSVAAFDARTGDVAWTARSDAPGYSSPVAATVADVRQIICFTGKGLAGLQPDDGKQLWYFPWATEFDANIATPVIAGNYVFISSGYNAGCALLELYADDGGVRAEPVYVKRHKLMRNHHATCVLYRGYLYGFDDNILKCVDIRTGEEKWASRRPGKGSLLAADGFLIVLTEAGSLALVEASPAGYREKGQLRDVLEGSDCWALPALADKRLYLRDQQHILCLDLKKK